MEESIYVIMVGAVHALLGVIVGGLVSYLAQSSLLRKQQQTEKRQNLHKRGEELFILLNDWGNLFTSDFICLASVMEGKIDYNEYLDSMAKEHSTFDPQGSGKIEFLISVQFPKLRSQFDAILKLRDGLSEARELHKWAYQHKNHEQSVLLPRFKEQALEFTGKLEELQGAVAHEVRAVL